GLFRYSPCRGSCSSNFQKRSAVLAYLVHRLPPPKSIQVLRQAAVAFRNALSTCSRHSLGTSFLLRLAIKLCGHSKSVRRTRASPRLLRKPCIRNSSDSGDEQKSSYDTSMNRSL